MERPAPKVPVRNPVLETKENIFKKFNRLVIFDAPTGLVKWHITNVRAAAHAAGVSELQLKDQLRPKLLKALRANPKWAVRELDDPKEIAQVREKPAETRRNSPKNNGNKTRRNVTVAAAATAASVPVEESTLATNAAVASSAAAVVVEAATNAKPTFGRPMFKKSESKTMIALFNKLTESNLDKILEQFLEITPESEAGMTKVIDTLLHNTTLNQHSHPAYVKFIKGIVVRHSTTPYPLEPTAALFGQISAKVDAGSQGAVMKAGLSKNANVSNNSFKDAEELQKQFVSLGFFAGYLVRDQLLSPAHCERLYRSLVTPSTHKDAAVRTLQDEDKTLAILGMIVRAGPRLVLTPEAHPLLAELMAFVTALASKPTTLLVAKAKDLLECARDGWNIKDAAFMVGAPPELAVPRAAVAVPAAAAREIRVAVAHAAAERAPERAPVRAVPDGLGADASQLYRRFPLEVLQLDAEENYYLVKIHGKKLAERCKADKKCEADLMKQIDEFVSKSTHWERKPNKSGLFQIERKDPRAGLGENPFALAFEYPVRLVEAGRNRYAVEIDGRRLHDATKGNKAKENTILGHVRRILDASTHWKVAPPPPKPPAGFFAMIEKK
jgi:hypothetical protein